MTGPNHVTRLALLSACFFAGLAVAVIGSEVSGSSHWYLAIPAAIAAGWLFVANPTECAPPLRRPPGGKSEQDSAP